jgi:hypothetical protein
VTTDQRVVAKQEIQEVESAKRAGAQYAHHRNQARDANTKLRQQLANAPRARRYPPKVNHREGYFTIVQIKPVILTPLRCTSAELIFSYYHLPSAGQLEARAEVLCFRRRRRENG